MSIKNSPTFTAKERPPLPDEVYPGIYVGPKSTVNQYAIDHIGIKIVINCAKKIPNLVPEFAKSYVDYYHLEIVDSIDQSLKGFINIGAKLIKEGLDQNGRILVHCEAGKSRSVSMVLSYLLEYTNTSLADALAEIQQNRPCASPNIRFLRDLGEYEIIKKGNSSLDLRNVSIVYLNGYFPTLTKETIEDYYNRFYDLQHENDLNLIAEKICQEIY